MKKDIKEIMRIIKEEWPKYQKKGKRLKKFVHPAKTYDLYEKAKSIFK